MNWPGWPAIWEGEAPAEPRIIRCAAAPRERRPPVNVCPFGTNTRRTLPDSVGRNRTKPNASRTFGEHRTNTERFPSALGFPGDHSRALAADATHHTTTTYANRHHNTRLPDSPKTPPTNFFQPNEQTLFLTPSPPTAPGSAGGPNPLATSTSNSHCWASQQWHPSIGSITSPQKFPPNEHRSSRSPQNPHHK